MDFCQELLLDELNERKKKNSAYSLRAFSRDLGVGNTSLSDYLANKRKLSKRNIENIIQSLGLSPATGEILFQETTRGKKADPSEDIRLLRVLEDDFRLIADWHYFAILNLAKIKKNKACSTWISETLGISEKEAEMALQRLIRLKYIEVKRGKLVRLTDTVSTTRDIPSDAIKQHHKGNLHLAEKALFNEPVERREFSSITVAADPNKLKEAADLLMKTKRKIAKMLSQGNPSEVYTLSMQLFPLTKEKTKK